MPPSHLDRDLARYYDIVGTLRLKNVFKPEPWKSALVVLRADHVKECQDAIDKEIKALSERAAKSPPNEAAAIYTSIDILQRVKASVGQVADAEARKNVPV